VDEAIGVLSDNGSIAAFGELLKRSLACQAKSKRERIESRSIRCTIEPGPQAHLAAIDWRWRWRVSLAICSSGQASDVNRQLNRLIHVPFKFEFSGSQVIFVDRQEDSQTWSASEPTSAWSPSRNLSRP